MIIPVKPAIYAHYFMKLKAKAMEFGYNLVLDGSMDKQLNLIAIPWLEELKPYEDMMEAFENIIDGYFMKNYEDVETGEMQETPYKLSPHGRIQYLLNVNRDMEGRGANRKDPQYCIDISIILVP